MRRGKLRRNKKKNENLTKFVSLTLISNCQIKDEREEKKEIKFEFFIYVIKSKNCQIQEEAIKLALNCFLLLVAI